MISIAFVVLLALFGSDLGPSTVFAGQDICSATADGAATIVGKVIALRGNKPLPTCVCGPAGTITQIVFTTTHGTVINLPLCSGCTGQEVLVARAELCDSIPHLFLRLICKSVCPKCNKVIKIFRCGCPAEPLTTKQPGTPVPPTPEPPTPEPPTPEPPTPEPPTPEPPTPEPPTPEPPTPEPPTPEPPTPEPPTPEPPTPEPTPP